METCRVTGCVKDAQGIDLCGRHYDRAHRLGLFGDVIRKMLPEELLIVLGPYDRPKGSGTEQLPEKEALLKTLREKYPTSLDATRTGPKPKQAPAPAPVTLPTPEPAPMSAPPLLDGLILGLSTKTSAPKTIKPTLNDEVAGANIALTNQLRDAKKLLVERENEIQVLREKLTEKQAQYNRANTANMTNVKKVLQLETQIAGLEAIKNDKALDRDALSTSIKERDARIEQHANLILALEAVGKTNVNTISSLEARIEELQMDVMTRPEGNLVVYRVELDIKGDPRILLTGAGKDIRAVAGLIGKKVRISE